MFTDYIYLLFIPTQFRVGIHFQYCIHVNYMHQSLFIVYLRI